uniref:Uncharacterized protein n=1 Tax=Arundo donax TaxID=35708 RepID=A0A0A9FEY7_ARUDO
MGRNFLRCLESRLFTVESTSQISQNLDT